MRNTVYGLLSIATNQEELGIEINYSKTAKEVYTDITRTLLHYEHIVLLVWKQPIKMFA
jgi:hypothetical protein